MSGGFLDRWSRRKLAAAGKAVLADVPAPGEAPPAAPDGQDVLVPTGPRPAPAADAGVAAAAPSAVEAQLPAVEELTLASDFTAFLKDEVSEALRRKALQKLFADPHFNRMDGLDIYIDDYSQPDPIPPEAMAKLKSAREWLMANEAEVEAVEAETAAQAEAFALPAERTDGADVPSDATNGEARDEGGGEPAGPGCADDGALRPEARPVAAGVAAEASTGRDAGSGQGTRLGGMHAEGAQDREARASASATDLGNAALRVANASVSDEPVESRQKAP